MSKSLNKNSNNSLNKLFYPNSIAIIGASNDKNKIGGFIFSEIKKVKNIILYPINLKEMEIQGLKSYPNIKEVKKEINLAIIVIPKNFVIESLKECIESKIKNVIIISAGFKEMGEEGVKRENEIKELVKKHNINLIGPNCLGIINAELGLNCSFAKEPPISGEIALVSQSGAVIDAIIDWSFKQNIGFSKIISLGNMAGVDSLKILQYLKDDPKTKAITFYMETLEKGEEFAKVLRETTKKKPVIIIKPGNSEGAKEAIGSHTGSLAQDNFLVETLIKENNGIFVKTINELFGVLVGLKSNMPKDNKLVILTNAGGPGVIATDSAIDNKFELYKLNDIEIQKFDFLPKEASIKNPIDILGDAKSDRYNLALEELIKIDKFSNILILLTPQVMTDNLNIAKEIVKISKKTKKTICVSFLGGKEIKGAIEYLDKNKIPTFTSPSDAMAAMNYLYKYKNFVYNDIKEESYILDFKKIEKITKKIENYKGMLDFKTTKEIFDVLKIELPKKIVVDSKEDIKKLELDKNKKYVLKVDSKDLIHKKDIGGVRTDILGKDVKESILEMRVILDKITNEYSITIEEQFSGFEIIVGLKSDLSLGRFIMFGMGGTYVDLYKDINFASCPLNFKSAKTLVDSSRAYIALNGFRGTKPIDFEHLFEILIRISKLQEIFPQIKEVDLNPIIASDKGIYLVDVKLIL